MAIDTPPVRTDGLQLEEKRDFQERFWSIERAAWVGFAALLLTALAGFTGAGGVLSQRTVSLDTAHLEYPLVARQQAAATLTLTFRVGGQHQIVLSPEFLRSFQLEQVQPRPLEERSGPEGLALVIDTDAGGMTSLYAKAQGPALASFQIQVGDGRPQTVKMLVLP